MKKNTLLKGLVLGICFLAYSFGVSANDTVRITWTATSAGYLSKNIIIRATAGEKFTVSWGNGVDSTYTGKGTTNIPVNHKYASMGTYNVSIVAEVNCNIIYLSVASQQITSLDVSNCSALEYLMCNINSLTSLDLSKNINLMELHCNDNKLTNLDLSKNTNLKKIFCSSNKLLTSLDLSENVNLKDLYCSENKLMTLVLNENADLTYLSCQQNQLPLSDLYAASLLVSEAFNKLLGPQILTPQTLDTGGTADFSTQTKFGNPDTLTVFAVTKNGSTAVINSDYTITNGVITFNTSGKYIVTMTNDAIKASSGYPAKVTAEFNVGKTGIADANAINPIQIYPNPTNGQLTINNEQLTIKNVELFDFVGKKLVSQFTIHNSLIEIDISHLANGMYFLKVDNKMFKIIKN